MPATKKKPATPESKKKPTPRSPFRLGAARPAPIMRKPEAQNFTGYGETVFDEKVAAGELPQPIRLTDSGARRSLGWLRTEMEAWLKKRIAVRDAELAQRKSRQVA